MTDYNEKINAIIAYFEDNDDVFIDCMDELDAICGYLGDDRYYSMDDFNDMMSTESPIDLVHRVFYGHDADTWTANARGDKTYGEFNPNRDYFTFNGYGNLVSTDYIDYTGHLDRYAVEKMLEYRLDIYAIENDDELADLFEQLENADGDDGEA